MDSYQQDREPVCLSPQSIGGFDEEPEQRTRSPHHVEMYTFRDAIDVNYQRMALTGEELSGVCSSFVTSTLNFVDVSFYQIPHILQKIIKIHFAEI